ncbi:MAG: helix-turn-helix domain-containing protein [Desulfobulbaceae bacterium]|nr:helix-turn-helix domain-containing protein [Desulfobulbaceae bacterium]
MDLEIAAARCAEIGNVTRLSILRLLVKAGRNGLSVGEIQRHLGIPGSTLSYHLQRLVQVALISQRRASRMLYCEPQYQEIRELAEFLLAECCSLENRQDG